MTRPFHLLSLGVIAGALAMAPAFAQSTPDQPASPDTRSSATSNPSTAPSNGSYANPTATPGTAANSGQTVPGTDMNSPSRPDYNNNHSFNFGWVGLVGLVGLLGLRRSGGRVDRYEEPRNVNNTGPGGIR